MPKFKTNVTSRSAKHWIFTIPVTSGRPTWDESKYSHLKFQKERGHETGYEHWQGCVSFLKKTTMAEGIRLMGCGTGIHIEPTRSEAALGYVCKEDTRVEGTESGPYEYGQPTKQGQRSDLESVYKMVREGKTISQIAEAKPREAIVYGTGINRLIGLMKPLRRDDIKVDFYYGQTGSGKTRYAVETYGDDGYLYTKMGNKYWDGYLGETVVLFDDFDKWFNGVKHPLVSWVDILSWCDRYARRVETKGSYTALNARHIIITSTVHWNDIEGIPLDFIRRINGEVKEFTC